MIELIYPEGPAPVLSGAKISRASEMLPVVDPNGYVTGQVSREQCHREGRLLHPVVHLEIIDRFSRLYLQHRSPQKKTWPERWDSAVGGHVGYGEHVLEALFREAGEELGLFDFNPHFIKAYIYEGAEERELVNLFAAVGSYDLHPDNYEVTEGRLWTMEEIEAKLGTGVFTPNFEYEFRLTRDDLAALL